MTFIEQFSSYIEKEVNLGIFRIKLSQLILIVFVLSAYILLTVFFFM